NLLASAAHAHLSTRTAGQAPDCLGYTSPLLATAHQEPWEILVAALLPCFRIYWEVGCAIAERAAAGNPYHAWIDTYAAPAFGEAVERMIGVVNTAADGTIDAVRDRMLAAITRACLYEYLFWDSAYHQRTWPPF